MSLPWVQVTWHAAVPVPCPSGVRRVVLTPTPDAPRGRYGAALQDAWADTPAEAVGLVVWEADVAIDPLIVRDLAQAVARQPRTVWAVPYRLWPSSTGRPTAIWAHRVDDGAGHPVAVDATVPCPRRCAAVGLGCTYLPGPLLNRLARDGVLAAGTYPLLDSTVSAYAHQRQWPMRTTRREAIHLHWGGIVDA